MRTVFLVLLLVPLGRTEREYFLQSNASSWELARKHCQVCYRELATITAENARHLLEKLDNSSRAVWVGLRRRLNETMVSSNSTNSTNSTGRESQWFSGTAPWFEMSNDTTINDTWFSFFEGKLPWSRWSNGDPVTFQNWYPGRPIPKPKPEPIKCDAHTGTSMNDSTPDSSTDRIPTVTGNSTVSGHTTVTGNYITEMPNQTTNGTTDQSNDIYACPRLESLLQCIDDQSVKDVLSSYITNPTYTTSTPLNNGSTISTDGPTDGTTMFDISTAVTTPSYPDNPNPTSFQAGVMPTSTSDPSTMSTGAAPPSASPPPTVPPCPNVTDGRELDLNRFIEDACLVLLSFGLWWERACSELLPYICYDDRFYGEVKVSNITNISAKVAWLEAPGEISGYRVEVKSKWHNWTETPTSNLTTDFRNLTGGVKYTVYVFPIKCGRDLNPQTTYFYSEPNFIQDLKILDARESSVSFSWSPPQGEVDFYRLCIEETCENTTLHNHTIKNLESGKNYTLVISAMVVDTPGPVISQYFFTKPKSVKNLHLKNVANNSLTVEWERPDENFNYTYSIRVEDSNDTVVFNKSIPDMKDTVSELSSGTEFNITVMTSIDVDLQSLRGDPESITAFTVPNPVSKLTLVPTAENITAEWNGPEGSYENFIVTLYDPNKTQIESTAIPKGNFFHNFINVKAGANYTVVVYVRGVGNQNSTDQQEWIYTWPKPPRNLKATVLNKTSISLKWDVPDKSKGVKIDYDVHYTAKFWNESNTTRVNSTSVTLHSLRPGTTYDFSVSVFAGTLKSENVTVQDKTEPTLRNITLTMLCSSSQFAGCQTATTVTALLEELKRHVKADLDGIYCEFE